MDFQEAPKSARSLPSPGTLVGGKYEIERYIAEGGMGVIARGRHVELDEPIALKFLKPDIVAADEGGTLSGRFVREARATIKIKSEHVPRIFDVSTLPSGVPYIVMELLEGEDLDHRLESQGPLPVVFVVDMLLQSLEALAAAHSLGMVHRDFKPANLFLSRSVDGGAWVKVLDFGIAKLIDQNGKGDQSLTGTSAVVGSPRYMAPEQMRASKDVDARADVWAVGTTLYELLTGVAAFNGETLTHVCASILQDEPEPISKRRTDVPRELEAVIRRCLAKRPEERYASVADLATALVPFGTAPSAEETARRVARVLGAAAALGSDPYLNVTGSLPPRYVVGAAAASSGSGQTNTSWQTISAASPTRRRTAWVLGSVLAVLVVAGAVFGGVAFFRSRSVAPLTAGGASTSAAPPAVVSETVPKPVAEAPTPASAESAVTPPPVAPTTPLTIAKPKTAEPKTPEPKTTPTTEPKPTTKPNTKPTASPSGGLWDDRK